MDIPRPQHRSLAVPKLVEAEQGVIAHARKMAVVGRSFWLAIDRTFAAVHVQNNPSMRGVSHGPLHPGSVEMPESFHVLLLGQHLSLESAHGVGAGRRLLRGLAAGDHSHGRVPSQPICIVDIFIVRQAAVHRLAQQRHQAVYRELALSRIGLPAYRSPLSPVNIPAIPADKGVNVTPVKPCAVSCMQNSCGGGNSMMESLRY
jgi:hypothetical protein